MQPIAKRVFLVFAAVDPLSHPEFPLPAVLLMILKKELPRKRTGVRVTQMRQKNRITSELKYLLSPLSAAIGANSK